MTKNQPGPTQRPPHGRADAREFASRSDLQMVNGERHSPPSRGQTTGADLYLRAQSQNPPSGAEMLAWLRRSALTGGEGVDLPNVLRVTRGDLIRARDEAMLEAAQSLGGDGCDTWVLAGRLSAAVARFQALHWPRLRAGGRVDNLGPADQALCRVFWAEVRVIKSQRKLYEFLSVHKSH